MDSNRDKIVADLIANALSAAKAEVRHHFSAEQHRSRERPLREMDPNSRTAELHKMPARAFVHRHPELFDSQRLESNFSGISRSTGNAKLLDEIVISSAPSTTRRARFWSDDKLIFGAILLVTVCCPLWPLVVLWVALLAGFRGFEKLGEWTRKQRRLFAENTSQQCE
jgi:hypothetical protein